MEARSSWSSQWSPSRYADAALAKLAGKGLRLVDARVGVFDEGAEVVGDAALCDAAEAEVPRHADLVDRLAVDGERLEPPSDQRPRLGLAAQRRDGDPLTVVHAEIGRQLGAEFDEALRLQFGEPGYPAGHAARGVVLGEPVCGDDVGEARIAHLVVAIVGS